MAKPPELQRPSFLWFVLLDGGILVLARLALNQRAHQSATELSGSKLPPQSALKKLLVGTAVVHVGEAIMAGRMARRRGISPRGWRLQTLVVGFPSLLLLRRLPPG
jgi:hypothetical protein